MGLAVVTQREDQMSAQGCVMMCARLVCDTKMHNRLSATNVVLVYLYKNKNIDTDIQVKKGHKRVHRLVCACACFNGDNHAIQSTSK